MADPVKYKIVQLAIVVPETDDSWMDLLSNLDNYPKAVLGWATKGEHQVVTKEQAETIFRSQYNDPDFFIEEDQPVTTKEG